MKVGVYSIEGKKIKEIELPPQFSEPYRPDLIKRAVISCQTARLQPKGTHVLAGLQTSAEYVGRRRAYRAMINRGIARLPRIKPGGGGFGQVRRVPQARKGRRAHPPKVEKRLWKRINRKERRKAIRSAIAASSLKELVRARGHVISQVPEIPLVVENKFEEIKKVKEMKKVLKALGLWQDVERAYNGRKARSGTARRRGRGKRTPKSVLIVVRNSSNVYRAARNLPGVDVVEVRNLNAELLAPGTHAGRLVLWTEGAIEELRKGLFL